MKRLTIVYVAGSGRSGSTLLDRALGSISGVGSLNEANEIFEQGYLWNRTCACGQSFSDCLFWQQVMQRTLLEQQPASVIDWAQQFDRSRVFPRLYWDVLTSGNRRKLNEYRTVLQRFFNAVAEESGADVLVDSSKIPTRALVLAGMPDVDLYVVHLVRDPRAVAYAWNREKHDPGRGERMDRYPLWRTMTYWAGRQMLSNLLSRRLPAIRVRYEDFAAAPENELVRIASFVPPLSGRHIPIAEGRVLHLGPIHTLSGNPDRFAHGRTVIKIDERWRESSMLPRLQRAFLMVGPLARRYGYV